MTTYIENLVQAKNTKIEEHQNQHSVGRVRQVQQYIIEVTGLEDVCFF